MVGAFFGRARCALLLAGALGAAAPSMAGGQAAAPVGKIPLEAFAAPPAMEDFAISPNGTKMAARVLVNGEQRFVVVPLNGQGGVATFAQDDVDVNWWRWVNDDWLVVGLGTSKLWYGQDLYLTRIAGFSADLTKINPIDWDRSGADADDLLWTAKDGSTRIRFAKMTDFETEEGWDPGVFEADVATGKTKLLMGARDNIYRWKADGDGNIRYAEAYDYSARSWWVFYRDSDQSPFTRIADSEDRDKSLSEPLIFGPNRTAYAMGISNGFSEVYEMTLPDFKLGKKVYSVPGYDVDAVYSNSGRNSIVGVNFYTTNERDFWFEPKLKDVQLQLDSALGAGNARIASWNRDYSKLIVTVGDASQAGGTYFLDTANGRPVLLGWSNPTLQNNKLSPVKSIRYKARDGTPIEAVLTLPRGRQAKALPLIVLPHGGPHVRDWENYDWWVQYLAEQGYAVIQPNYRGSTGYGEAFEDLGEGQWGLKMQDDLIDAIGWAAAQGIADPKRVCIAGASYGGYAAMRAAQRDGASYRCSISYAGVSDLNAIMKYDRKFLIGESATKYWKQQAADFVAVSPAMHANEFTVPILIMHGTKDKRVPVKQSRILAEGLRRAGKSFEYVEQPKGDHHFSRTEDRLEFLQRMKAFLDKHNPA